MYRSLRGDGPDLLKESQHVELSPLLDNATTVHPEHVDAAQFDRPTGRGNACETVRVDAPPGDPVGDEVALRDLIVYLIGVARHAVGDAADEVLESSTVHGCLPGHVRHKVSGENLGALVGRAVVIADGAPHQRLVVVQ